MTAISYPADSHDLLYDAEDAGAWFQRRNRLIADLVRKHPFEGEFVEVGAGNGIVAKYLQDKGVSLRAVEPLAPGAANCRKRGIKNVEQGTLESLSLPSSSVGAIGAFDVLEHLKHPEVVLTEAHRVLRPGAPFFATVPAHQFLWSQVDELSGHFKRYSKADFEALFRRSGFAPHECGFFMNLLVLPAFLSRVLPKILGREESDEEARARTTEQLRESALLGMALSIEEMFNLPKFSPFGTSLYGVFIKR